MELSGRVAVAIIYICEAHATDEWPISSARFNAGRGPVCVAQPKRNAERCQLARRFASDFGLEGLPLLVDAAEGADADAYERAYAPWPLRFHGVVGGAEAGSSATIDMVAHPKDCGYDIASVRSWALAVAAAREAAE